MAATPQPGSPLPQAPPPRGGARAASSSPRRVLAARGPLPATASAPPYRLSAWLLGACLLGAFAAPPATATDAKDCPSRYRPGYEADWDLAKPSWEASCREGVSPERILEKAKADFRSACGRRLQEAVRGGLATAEQARQACGRGRPGEAELTARLRAGASPLAGGPGGAPDRQEGFRQSQRQVDGLGRGIGVRLGDGRLGEIYGERALTAAHLQGASAGAGVLAVPTPPDTPLKSGAKPPAKPQRPDQEALSIIRQSPRFLARHQEVLRRGYSIEWGPAGGGTFIKKGRKVIVVDSSKRGRPREIASSLAHEYGHAGHVDRPTAPEGVDQDTFVRANVAEELADEGEATLFNMEVRDELLSNGIAIRVSGTALSDYEAIYKQYKKDGDRDKARRAIGAVYAVREHPSTSPKDSYGDYYTRRYTDLYQQWQVAQAGLNKG